MVDFDMKQLDVGAVVLSWNGASDTLECLASLYAQDTVPSHVVLVDNGSTDGTIADVLAWVRAHHRFRARMVRDDVRDGRGTREIALYDGAIVLPDVDGAPDAWLVIVENGTNLGFAIANNVGIRLLMTRGVKYVMLLNNDTILEQNALSALVAGMEQSPERNCLVPQIRYWGDRRRIWNCGGEWTWYGMPRYFYADDDAAALGNRSPFEVTFVTGCAVLIRAAWLAAHGLLSERFFFGEEDVELSWRMRSSGPGSMGCWPQAIIYHKVGTSITKMAELSVLPKLYCYYVNRMIFLGLIWGKGVRWQAWRLVFSAHIMRLLLFRFGLGPSGALAFVRDLAHDASRRDGVSAEFFFWIMKEKFHVRGRDAVGTRVEEPALIRSRGPR